MTVLCMQGLLSSHFTVTVDHMGMKFDSVRV